jgi:hypothetical protein
MSDLSDLLIARRPGSARERFPLVVLVPFTPDPVIVAVAESWPITR